MLNLSKINKGKLDREGLVANCADCFGYCCVALYFSKTEGFPVNKAPGVPCPKLCSGKDFRCSVHADLKKLHYKGCMSFDCFGAGQKVARLTFEGVDWRSKPELAEQMFEVFLAMRQLHEMLWYLVEAWELPLSEQLHFELEQMLEQTEELTLKKPGELLSLDLNKHRALVNPLLVKASEQLRANSSAIQTKPGASPAKRGIPGPGADLIGKDLRSSELRGSNLRGACLIAADLRDVKLQAVDLIGADFRDADVRGTDFTGCIFLTQAQLNTMKGNEHTKIPDALERPMQWEVESSSKRGRGSK